MYYLNFNNDVSEIKIHYTTERESLNVEDSIIQKNETFKMNFKGIKVNLYDNNFDVDLTSQDKINGEENIYLKGGEGSAGIINLFDGADTDGNGVSDLLEEIREKNWIINEANLMVYVNEDISPIDSDKARRLFVYNADKNRILTDYQNDPTVNNDNPSTSASIHLPPLDEDENGNKYL